MKRVLLLGRGLGPGGMERLLVTQVQFGDRERFDYEVAYISADRNHLVPELEALGVPVRCIGASRVPWPVELVRLLRSRRYDVVHIHSPAVAAVGRPIARLLRPRPRLVYTEHNSWAPYGRLSRFANRVTYRLDDAQIAVSQAAFESVPPHLRGRLDVLSHGIDVDAVARHRGERSRIRAELGFDDHHVVVGIVANLRPEKNYDGMVRVAGRVTAEHPEARFVSIGQGPLLEPVREQVTAAGLSDGFRLLGYKQDATSYMAAFDVFTLGSHVEGLPVAFMEARALGLPVVVTAVGGLVDHVDDGVDGLLVPPRDDAALAAAIGSLVADPTTRRRMADASAARSSELDARRSVAAVEARYTASG